MLMITSHRYISTHVWTTFIKLKRAIHIKFVQLRGISATKPKHMYKQTSKDVLGDKAIFHEAQRHFSTTWDTLQ